MISEMPQKEAVMIIPVDGLFSLFFKLGGNNTNK